jgi:hypothetical protein
MGTLQMSGKPAAKKSMTRATSNHLALVMRPISRKEKAWRHPLEDLYHFPSSFLSDDPRTKVEDGPLHTLPSWANVALIRTCSSSSFSSSTKLARSVWLDSLVRVPIAHFEIGISSSRCGQSGCLWCRICSRHCTHGGVYGCPNCRESGENDANEYAVSQYIIGQEA